VPQFDTVQAGIGLGANALKAMELMDEKFAKLYDQIKFGNPSTERVHEQIEILAAEEGFWDFESLEGKKCWTPEV